MKIVYLYAEVMGYTMATIRELIDRHVAELHIVHLDSKKLTPYKYQNANNVTFYGRSAYSTAMIKELVSRVDPDLVVVSGWQDRGYLQVARLLRKKGIPVVTGFDDQWHGTPRQIAASYFSFFLKRYFSHAWVSGPYQFEFARRMGFNKDEIVFNLYSADLTLFNDVYNKAQHNKQSNYPHRFLFVGRFEKIKGVDLLVETWNSLGDKRKDWELHFIGDGSLKSYLKAQTGITISDFMQPNRLKDEILGAGCFILPSRKEPWGVVIHEFVAAGLPIICSDTCGAAPVFLIHGLNGFSFKSENIDSLSRQMLNIINTDDQELCKMSEHSHGLGQQITPAMSAASLISIKRQTAAV
ncbi:MAG: glycosyltransferase family 4 protein [Candidatus Methanoperedens sp.]|nr:glycosyltransferase family 4 protein [Candidatus Methanoperedens sp.]